MDLKVLDELTLLMAKVIPEDDLLKLIAEHLQEYKLTKSKESQMKMIHYFNTFMTKLSLDVIGEDGVRDMNQQAEFTKKVFNSEKN